MDGQQAIRTDVPARLDRLPWSPFHRLVVAALGITWVLDGLEVTLAGSVAAALQQSPQLHLTAEQVGLTGTAYLTGAILGSLLFGHLTDRLGRKRLFNVTLGLYLAATALTALSWDFASFAVFRFLTGAGIGGEYTAINSAIQELIPARLRGRTDLAINGSFWLGAALGASGSIWLLDPAVLSPEIGWRLAFGTGAVLGLVILYLRRFVPESPRWLMTHGRVAEAEGVVTEIEGRVTAATGAALVPARFYGVPASDIGWYILPFTLGNFCGPLLLGPLFDTIGRKPMIAATYTLSGVLLAATAALFAADLLDAATLTLCWTVVFFFASAAASAAYLTVGECFPLELRALAIALFYAFGTLLGGAFSPWLFGVLIESGSRGEILGGYLLGAGLMVVAALVEVKLGIDAERRPLEDVARPLSSHHRAEVVR